MLALWAGKCALESFAWVLFSWFLFHWLAQNAARRLNKWITKLWNSKSNHKKLKNDLMKRTICEMFVVRCGHFLSCSEGESSPFVGLDASIHKTAGLWGRAEWIIRTHNKHWVSSLCWEVGGLFFFFLSFHFFSFHSLWWFSRWLMTVCRVMPQGTCKL